MPRARPTGWIVCVAHFTEAGCPNGRACTLRHDATKCACGALVLCQSITPHRAGKKHQKFVEQEQQQQPSGPLGVPAEPVAPVPEKDRLEKCHRCRRVMFAVEMEAHVAEHERQDKIQKIQEELVAAEGDKEGIVVDMKDGIDFGVLPLGDAKGETVNMQRTQKGAMNLVSASLRSSNSNSGSSRNPSAFTVTLAGKGAITIRKPRVIVVVFNLSDAGYYEDTLELVFAYPRRGRQFVITRRVYGTAGSPEDQEELKPRAPYKKKKWIPLLIDGPVILSPRPAVWSPIKWVNVLPKFDPPQALIDAAFQPNTTEALRAVKRLMPTVFNINTYGDWFQTLLHIEGEQRKRDLDHYALQDAELKQNKYHYDLQVKGVIDRRPSVLVGDYILARRSGDSDWYQGRVHKVHFDILTLYFPDGFSNYRGNKYDIRFVYNRLPDRRKHLAVISPYKPMRLLFPDKTHIKNERVTRSEVVAINPEMQSNYEQLEAVAAIVKQPPGSVPFIIFGPPGTGKTLTIVEAMRQLLLQNPNARIIACAPSNTAADIITDRLKVLGKSVLFRLNSLSRKTEDLNKDLHSYSLVNDNNVFAFPPLEELKKYRVIVTTCISAGVLWGIGFKKGYFSHIFIDEAGQSEEPEIMIPFRTLANDSTNFVLAGDHRQLNPDIRSTIGRKFEFHKSYLKRLMDREMYDIELGRGLTVVKLLKNFRSHEAILKFSNDNFYNSELKSCGDPVVTHSLENHEILPKKKFPIIFHGVAGRDQREESSPSFFNIDEATIVKSYCLQLVSDRKKGTRPEHIGVIAPYHSQKCKIQQLFHRELKLRGIKVGTVDEFQGQERRVIILSTVRSTPNHLSLDIRRSLGFVASPLRLNVAMTRAQALLIVVGNPIVLSLDPLWRSFLNYVHNKGGWRGIGITWNPEEDVNIMDYGFDAKYRAQAESQLEDTLTRLRAIVSQNLEQFDLDIDLGSDGDDDETYIETEIRRDGE